MIVAGQLAGMAERMLGATVPIEIRAWTAARPGRRPVMTWLLAKGTGKPLLEKDIVFNRSGLAHNPACPHP